MKTHVRHEMHPSEPLSRLIIVLEAETASDLRVLDTLSRFTGGAVEYSPHYGWFLDVPAQAGR